jgi:hypothetical protein
MIRARPPIFGVWCTPVVEPLGAIATARQLTEVEPQ